MIVEPLCHAKCLVYIFYNRYCRCRFGAVIFCFTFVEYCIVIFVLDLIREVVLFLIMCEHYHNYISRPL